MGDLRRLAAVLLFAWSIVHPGLARAQSAAPIELKWSALESCPSAETVLARVRKIAGPTRAAANALRADASVTQPSDGMFRLRLEIRYGNLAAVRTIEGKSCKDLAGAAAVALALLLSSEEPLSERDLAGTAASSAEPGNSSTPGSSASSSGNQNSNALGTPPQASTASARSPEVTPSTPPSNAEVEAARRWHVLLWAPVGSLGIGPMKQSSRGLGAGAGLSYDRWRFLAEGRLWASQHETVSNLGDAYDVELDRFTVGARGCHVVFGDRFEFAPCALMSVHHLSVRGSGPNLVSGTDSATWAAIGVGARVRLVITPWFGLVTTVDGELELARPEVSVSLPVAGSPGPTAVPVVQLAPVAATLSFGAEWIF